MDHQINAKSQNLEEMREAFERVNLMLKGENPKEKKLEILQIVDYKINSEKKQLNVLLKCRYEKSERIFEKWMLSEDVLEINPRILTELLIQKTKFGSGIIKPEEESMIDYRGKQTQK